MPTKGEILSATRSSVQRGNMRMRPIPSVEAQLPVRGPAGRISPEVKGQGSGYVHVSEITGPRHSSITVFPSPQPYG